MKRYYSTLRPVGPGTVPRGFATFRNYDQPKFIEEIGRKAWGYVEYEKPLARPEDWDLLEGGK